MFRAEDVTELLYDDPFEPFELELTTGERFAVQHPENMIVPPHPPGSRRAHEPAQERAGDGVAPAEGEEVIRSSR